MLDNVYTSYLKHFSHRTIDARFTTPTIAASECNAPVVIDLKKYFDNTLIQHVGADEFYEWV